MQCTLNASMLNKKSEWQRPASKFVLAAWNRFNSSVVQRWLPAQAEVVWGEGERSRVEGFQQVQSERYVCVCVIWAALRGVSRVQGASPHNRHTHLEFSLKNLSAHSLCSEWHAALPIIVSVYCLLFLYTWNALIIQHILPKCTLYNRTPCLVYYHYGLFPTLET